MRGSCNGHTCHLWMGGRGPHRGQLWVHCCPGSHARARHHQPNRASVGEVSGQDPGLSSNIRAFPLRVCVLQVKMWEGTQKRCFPRPPELTSHPLATHLVGLCPFADHGETLGGGQGEGVCKCLCHLRAPLGRVPSYF